MSISLRLCGFFASVARHFHFVLAVVDLLLFKLAILRTVACNFHFELAIFALIWNDFAVDLANFAARALPFR